MKIDSGRMLNDYILPNKKQYCIPVFQRDYAWTSEQCEKLFEDIVFAFKKDRPHFCGSFVYKLYFKSSKYQTTDDDTAEGISRQLDIMFAEIQEYEKGIAEKWDR